MNTVVVRIAISAIPMEFRGPARSTSELKISVHNRTCFLCPHLVSASRLMHLEIGNNDKGIGRSPCPPSVSLDHAMLCAPPGPLSLLHEGAMNQI